MSTANPQTQVQSPLLKTDLDPITVGVLNRYRMRRGWLLLLRTAGVSLLVFISLTLLLATLDYVFFLGDLVRWTASLAIYVSTAAAAWLLGVEPMRNKDSLSIAQRVESAAPELREDLVSAVELADPSQSNGSRYFRGILQKRVAKRLSKIEVRRLLPVKLVARWVLSGGAVAAVFVSLFFIPSAQFGRRFARAALPGVAIERASRTRVTIVEPSPPSRYVAERDAVAVVADIDGVQADDVVLQWRSDDGTEGESMMTPRMDAERFQPGFPVATDREGVPVEPGSPVATGQPERRESNAQRFAANVSVGSVPLQYRILAGDAITLWHKLTPLPRPRVTNYSKRYRFPTYAQLDDRVAEEEHGDLEALQGTTAELTVTFDQPVEEAVLRFGLKGATMRMKAANEASTQYSANVSIKTAGQYQVDAVSIESGLNNPFSPTNTINPIIDTPPLVRWSEEIPDNQLVSSLDVVKLSGIARDDLPLDRVVQEFTMNNGVTQEWEFPLSAPDRKLEFQWDWDLMDRLADGTATSKLQDGDLLQTRLVVSDRFGTRMESRTIEVLVAGDGFDADRHRFLESFAARSKAILDWATSSRELAEKLEAMLESDQFDGLVDLEQQWPELQATAVELIKTQVESLGKSQNDSNALLTELEGRAILDVDSRIEGLISLTRWVADHVEPQWAKERETYRKRLGYRAKSAGHQAGRLTELVRGRFSLAFTAAMYSDAQSLRLGLARMIDSIPDSRLDRYVTLLAGKFGEMDRLLGRFDELLSPTTSHHLSGESWESWSQRWAIQFETLLEDKPRRDQVLAVLNSLREQMEQKPQSLIDSRIHDTIIRSAKDLPVEMAYLSDLTRELNDAGWGIVAAKAENDRERDAEKAIRTAIEWNFKNALFQETLQRLTVRASGEEKLNRAKSRVDLKYAADQNLFIKAIRNVTENGYTDYREEPAREVFENIRRAIDVLQASSMVAAVRNSVAAVRDGERQSETSPIRKIFQPTWFALKNAWLDLPIRHLRDSKADDRSIISPLNEIKYNADHRQANDRIDRRRWSRDAFVSALKPLERITLTADDVLGELEPMRESAREVLRRYVLKLSEQAREAADAAREAEQKTDERPDDSKSSLEDVRDEQDQAVEKATGTIQALIDQANTADITSAEDRELARDADAAAELIADALQETREQIQAATRTEKAPERKEALENAEAALETLAERLEQTAEHFEMLENGEDASESREQLRRDEAELEQSRLEERYQQAEDMAQRANQDPRALLEQLERELQTNEPMQEALTDISSELVNEAKRNLEQASRDEGEIERRLEAEDAAFSEKKRQKRMLLNEFVQRADTLRDQTLNIASQAASWANEVPSREQLNEVRDDLREASDAARKALSDQSTLAEIQDASESLQQAMQQGAETAADVAQQMGAKKDDNLHKDDRARDSAAKRLESMQNRLRNDEVRAIDRQRSSWSSQERSVSQRVRTAEQQARNAQSTINRLQSQQKKEPDNDSLKNSIANEQQKKVNAEQMAEQAKQTRDLTREQQDKANQRSGDIKRQKSERLNQPNPAAELAERVAGDAAERLNRLAEELQELRDASNFETELQASPDDARSLADQQERVRDDVDEASADVARASRHESRLGQEQLAQRLEQASQQIEEQAGGAAENAMDELTESAGQSDNADKAAEAIQQAAESIDQQVQGLDELLTDSQTQQAAMPSTSSPSSQQQPSESSRPNSPPPADVPSADPTQSPNANPQTSEPGEGNLNTTAQSPPSGSTPQGQSQAQQLAQTLDELDRMLAEQASGQSQPGEPQDGQPGQPNGQPGEQPNGQPGQQPEGQASPEGNGQASQDSSQQGSPTAADASPTLAEMLEAAMQQAARERMQSLQQAQGQQGQESSNPDASANPADESGAGDPPSGPEDVQLLDEDMLDGDWGSLRRRGVDDAAQGSGLRIPPGYSKEVRAYFKALSKRAAEKSE